MRCLKIVGVTAVGAIIASILDYYGCNRLWPELVALNTGIILGKMLDDEADPKAGSCCSEGEMSILIPVKRHTPEIQ